MHFGSLVAPLSFHNPVMLAYQAMALNDLSGGRMILGLGSGWHDEEHIMFGYQLGDKKTRLDRLEEGLQVITAPVQIMIGGNGPSRTLPLVASYADVWNCQVAEPAVFKEMNRQLDEMILREHRQTVDVKRTVLPHFK